MTKLVRRDDFLLMLTLRLLKYISFSKAQKIFIFTILLTSETLQSLEPHLDNIDEAILKNNQVVDDQSERINIEEFEKEMTENRNTGGRGKKEKNEVIYDRSFDDESFDNILQDEKEKKNELNKRKEEVYQMIKELKDAAKPQEQIDSETVDREFNYKKKKGNNNKNTYPFMNDLGESFKYIKDCDGVCPFCSKFKGLFSSSDQEFKDFCLKELEKGSVIVIKDDADLTLSIFQTVFEFTLEDPIMFLYRGVVPFYCQLLISQEIPIKYKFPLLLYLSHLISNFKNGAEILFGVSFILFTKDFLSKFMSAFDLESFEKKKKQAYKFNVPKNQDSISFENSYKKQIISSETSLNPLIRKLDGSKIDLAYEEIEVNGTENLIWCKKRNCFVYENGIDDESVTMEINTEQQDAITDDGNYTKFFWQFHFMIHCLKVVHEMIQKAPAASNQIVEKQLEGFLENIREMITIFYKYSEKYLPTQPFHEDTECWTEMKEIMFETSV